MGVMCRVCGLRMSSNFGVWLTANKNFYLQLTVEKMHAFAVFTEKYLGSYGCNGTNFTDMVVCTNQKMEILIEIIETELIGI